MNKRSKIAVFGAGGLIGSEIVSRLKEDGYTHINAPTHNLLDLENQEDVFTFFEKYNPEYIFFCALRSIKNFDTEGCVDAAEMYSNITMQLNVMEAARINHCKKAVFLGSAMIYPWNNEYEGRLKEDILEDFRFGQYPSSAKSMVLSKFALMTLCQYYYLQYGCKFVCVMPTHVYGTFKGRKNLPFLESLVKDLCDAKINGMSSVYLDIFGRGKAQKQFLYVRDCADAIILVMKKYEDFVEPINIGTDKPESWSTIVEKISEIIHYKGKISFNSSHEENMTNRICSIEKLNALGWKQAISIDNGLRSLCEEYFREKSKVPNEQKPE